MHGRISAQARIAGQVQTAASARALLPALPVDIAWLEAAVPIAQLAHLMAEDGLAGPDATVMVSPDALAGMRRHWRAAMILLRLVRSSYLRRFPEAKAGWSGEHLERLATCAAALPAYLMLRCDRPLAGEALHLALCNISRLADLLRLEALAMGPGSLPDSHQIAQSLGSRLAGVSGAASRADVLAMADDVLGVVLDGREPRSGWSAKTDAWLNEAINAVEPAIDYAMLSVQSQVAIALLWPELTHCCERLSRLLQDPPGAVAGDFARRIVGNCAGTGLDPTNGGKDWRSGWIAEQERRFAGAWRAVRGRGPCRKLSSMLDPSEVADQTSHQRRVLERAVLARLGVENPVLAEVFAELAFEFLLFGQEVVAQVEEFQLEIAALLHRPDPARNLDLSQLGRALPAFTGQSAAAPFLPDDLADTLGLLIQVTARQITIEPASVPA